MSEKHLPIMGGGYDRIVCDLDGTAWVREPRDGAFTREDVEGAFVSGYSLGMLPVGSDPQWDQNEQTADEYMAELGWVRERTCECDGTLYWDCVGTTPYYEHELSCGHVIRSTEEEPPNYCEVCGAKVVGE